jgi:hypothetical protein
VRERVIAQREAGSAPEFEDLFVLRRFFEPLGINKSIDRQRVRVLQRLDDAPGDVCSSRARRKTCMSG